MTDIDARTRPADPRSADRLRERGYDYRVVDTADAGATAAFLRAETRGFLDAEPSDASRDEMATILQGRRNIGVFDGDDPLPIATVNSWVTPLTVPGGEVPMWAISSVTVSATHRRRGIARQLLEGELRAAAEAGAPLAGLTVSEATIYGRYGFGAAVPVAEITVDARRAGWAAPEAGGRLSYAEKEELATVLGELHERARRQRAGQIAGWTGRWRRMAGLGPADRSAAEVRGVIWRDDDGEPHGAVVYTLKEVEGEFRATIRVRHLVADTAEGLRALWSFLVHHDLVNRISVDLRPIDDPVTWLVADQRAVTQRVHDHGWVRILDVPSALQARSYAASDIDLVIAVTDALGFADGSWRVRVNNGHATVLPTTDTADVTLDVSTLSSAYLGGISLRQLAAAGRVQGDQAAIGALSDALRTDEAPLLSIWY